MTIEQVSKCRAEAKEAAVAGNLGKLLRAFGSLQSEHVDLGWLAIWQLVASEESPVFSRVLAFLLAKASQEGPTPSSGEACSLWLLNNRAINDVSTCINQLTALQVAASSSERIPLTVNTSVLPFVERCLQHREVSVRHSALEFLHVAADEDQLKRFVHKGESDRLSKMLVWAIRESAEEAEKKDLDEVVAALRDQDIPIPVQVAPRPLRRLILDLEDVVEETQDLIVGAASIEGLMTAVGRRTLLDDAGHEAIRLGTAIQTVRVPSHSASIRLVDEIWSFGEAIAAQRQAPQNLFSDLVDYGVRAVAAPAASFPVHLTYAGDDAERVFDLLAIVMAAVKNDVAAAQSIQSLDPAVLDAAVRLVNRLSDAHATIEISITRPSGVDWQRTIYGSFSNIPSAFLKRFAKGARSQKRTAKAWIDKSDVPQANTVKCVFQAVEAMIRRGRIEIEDIDEINSRRQINYYQQGARVLGFFDDDNMPTGRAMALNELDLPGRMKLAAVYFEDSAIGRAWRKWSGKDRLVDIDPNTAEAFLNECVIGLSGSTPERRASTLRKWLHELVPYHYASIK